MLRRSLPEAGSFFRRLLSRGSLEGGPAAGATAPFRHFVEQLVGGAAPISCAPSAAASAERGTGGSDRASLTVHFLRHSCGLEDADAAKAAERVHLRSTKNARAVLALLRDTLGLPPASVARLVAAYPALRRFLLASPNRFLTAGLHTRLRPNLSLLRNLLGTEENVLAAVKQSMELIYGNLEIVLLPKLQVLRDHGVTEEVLVKLVTTHPKALVHRSTRFDEGLAAMKDLGVSPDSGIFPYAFGVFAKMYQSKWDRRVQNYVSLGWTEEQVRRAFVRHPYCMSVSEDKVKKCMQFIAEKLGWNPDYVSSCPTVLSFSHEKRVLPRYRVLDILVSRGVIKNGIRMSHLTMSEKKFKEKYVDRYHEDITQVLEAYGARTVA
ncbi:unnamed protein product [Miscanthus lutarioriparius]|uniref:Uncharacterized protein n=1 Tax=Miscanthus lutarioriparius TaxID=422564 RepID=A0A811R6C2_9POAL|nr:unnamed protein product [Miscanthus lutarioriparius]